MRVGNIVTFGTYEQDNNTSNGKEDIEWIVLANEGNRSLLISRYALDCQQYNTKFKDVTWETCSLRPWLNGTFLNAAFTADEQKAIQKTSVDNGKSQGNSSWSTNGGNNTTDQIFLLSYAEAGKYFASDSDRICKTTAYAKAQGAYTDDSGNCWWWLRSPDSRQRGAASVTTDGSLGHLTDGSGGSTAVRPAFWINLNTEATSAQISSANNTIHAEPAEAADGKVTATGTAQGIDGEVEVQVTADATTIYSVEVLKQNETPGIGSVAVAQLPDAIVAANSYDVDGIAGATVTSTAIRNAVKMALESAGFDPAGYVTGGAPAVAEAAGGIYVPGTYTAEATGMGKVIVNVTVDANAITAIEIDGSGETPGIGQAAIEPLGEQVMTAQGATIDGVTGATLTSNAVRTAVASALVKAAA